VLRDNRKTTSLEAGNFKTAVDTAPDSVEVARLALARLKPADREILVLKEFQGFSYREIAEILSCTIPAVRSRLYEARQRIRGIYKKLIETRCGL
jgi:DNA-directed RNA polymerase specialized sigma24 family protein